LVILDLLQRAERKMYKEDTDGDNP
jgi:hypothetical protein